MRFRLPFWSAIRAFAFMSLPFALHAVQFPIAVQLFRADAYRQTSASTKDYAEGQFYVRVDFTPQPPDQTIVKLRKPNGTLVTFIHPVNYNIYYVDERFSTSAQLAAAYPNGTYQIQVTGGGLDQTLSIPVTFTSISPLTVTNFDELQSITSSSAQVKWTSIPMGGEQEQLGWRLFNANNNILQVGALLPDPRQTSMILQDLQPESPIRAELTYSRLSASSVNNGATSITVLSGFSASVPLYRVGTKPAPPAAFGGFATGDGDILLSWQVSSAGGEPSTYQFERSTSPDFPANDTYKERFNAPFQTSLVDRSAGPIPTLYYYRLTAFNAYGSSAPSKPAEVQSLATLGRGATTLVNIATRARCSTGANVTIGGFVVSGNQSKRVLIRAVGPTLATQGVNADEVLKDPTMSVYRGDTVIASNDNWGTNSNASEMVSVATKLGASPFAPTDTTSAAVLIDLPPGVYSFVVNGKSSAEGVVLLEVYDADSTSDSRFVNIATRAYATTGAGVTIGGFVVRGEAPKQVLLRAVGPTLSTQGIPSDQVLADPVIELYRSSLLIATNDNWTTNENAFIITTVGASIGATPLTDTKSAALLIRLPPGVYSFLASGRNNSSGIVLVEVYEVGR